MVERDCGEDDSLHRPAKSDDNCFVRVRARVSPTKTESTRLTSTPAIPSQKVESKKKKAEFMSSGVARPGCDANQRPPLTPILPGDWILALPQGTNGTTTSCYTEVRTSC